MGVLIYFFVTPIIFWSQLWNLDLTAVLWLTQPLKFLFVDYNPTAWIVFIASLLVGWLFFEIKDKK